MPLTGKEMVRLLKKYGWIPTRKHGSHQIMVKNDEEIVVPVHTKELGKGLERLILKRANIKK